MKPLKRLDPTWWRKVADGYDQQDGRARLVRLMTRGKVTSWALYVDGESVGAWPSFREAKARAAKPNGRGQRHVSKMAALVGHALWRDVTSTRRLHSTKKENAVKTKVHKVILLVVDHDQLGAEDVGSVLENARYPNHCIHPSVMHVETREVDWDDGHPLNNTNKQAAAFEELFK